MWWTLYFDMWLAMLPSEATQEEVSPETESYLVSELRDDLELLGVQGIIDEGGR
jgi:hypothetical protein